MHGRTSSPRGWGCVYLSILATLIGSPAHPQPSHSPYEVVVQLRIERGPDQVIFAFGRDSSLLAPLGPFLDLAEIEVGAVDPGRRYTGTLQPGAVPFQFVTDSGYVLRGSERIAYGATEAMWSDLDLFISPRLLEQVFGVVAYMDWAELQLIIRNAGALPVVQRLERTRRRLLADRWRSTRSLEPLPTVRRIVDGAALDWAVTSSTRDPLNTSSMSVGFGSQFLGGSLELSYRRDNSPVEDLNFTNGSWVRAWPDEPRLRQVRLGDLIATGRGSRLIRGASVTNAPFLRPVAFAEDLLVGQFPEGWEVELYRGQQLIGFTVIDESQRYGLNLPVQYGPNPIELVGYGPHGEVVRWERTLEIPFQRLPARNFEYGLSAGECQTPGCTAAWNLDARYGATNRVTLQIGSDYFWRDTLPDKWHPYALVSVAPTRALSLTAEGVLDGIGRARADYIPTPDLRVSAIQTWFDTSDPAPLVGSLTQRHRTDVFAFWRPASLRKRLFFEARAARASSTIQTTYTTSLATTFRLATTRLTTGVRHEWAPGSPVGPANRTRFDGDVQSILQGPWDWTESMLVRGRIGVERRRGVVHFALGVGRQIRSPFRIDVDATWDRGQPGLGLGLVFTSVLPSLRTVSRNRYREDFGVQGTQSFEGSVLWNRHGQRAEFGNGRALGRAGVTGTVYFDANANGEYDPDEQGVPGVRVQIGTTAVLTDSLGWFSVKDLVPFEAMSVEVDTLSIDNPLWIPTHGPGAIHPTPNSYQLIELPLQQAGEVVGRVVMDSGRGLAGATVLLHNLTTNETIQVVTYSDGTFYALGVKPGAYEASVGGSLLRRLNADADAARFVVGSRGTDSSVEDVVIRVVRN